VRLTSGAPWWSTFRDVPLHTVDKDRKGSFPTIAEQKGTRLRALSSIRIFCAIKPPRKKEAPPTWFVTENELRRLCAAFEVPKLTFAAGSIQ